jgi:protein-S-isoprenylcysteine O-methyltransferase Ste14
MGTQPGIGLAWVAWLLSWLAASWWSSRTAQRVSAGREIKSRVILVVGAVLLFGLYPHERAIELPLWRLGPIGDWLLVALTVLGFLFAWWARLHLGRLWSATVTRKAEHRVVDTGPYGLVRHPIYTGIIVATLATAADRGTALGWLGATLMIGGWYLKARLEERFLGAELPGYDDYARRVPMLMPFVRV